MMIDKICKLLEKATLSQTNGKYLGDKAYAYDDIYFMSKYIIETADDSNIFNKRIERTRVTEYIRDLFQLRGLGSGAINYLNEALNVLIYAGIIIKLDKNSFKIVHMDVLKYIASRVENAYIFLYLVVYKTLNNDDIFSDYINFCNLTSQTDKENILKVVLEKFKTKSASIGGRRNVEDTNWSKQLVKYSFTVLGFANTSEYVARTLKTHLRDGVFQIVTVEDISINIEGTRTNKNSKKINDYINRFAKKYVQYELKNYLIKDIVINEEEIEKLDHIAEDLADLKIEKLIKEYSEDKYFSKYEKDQYVEQHVKVRNQNVRKTFKDGLLKNNAHRCPICGFEYEEFLVGSHIKPYTKCDDTYDAINDFNGLLLCPNHDKLFEGARLMTIDASTGQIILAKKAAESKDFGALKGNFIDKSLVECERRHYLKWHNEQFYRINKTDK